jgi:type II secretory pathway pseudopilin PulG
MDPILQIGDILKAKKSYAIQQGGFTYLGMLALLMVMLLWSGAAMQVSQTMLRRDKEAELIFIGNQYRLAIVSFYLSMGRFPASLDELLNSTPAADKPRRFLRRIYRDPITGKSEWGYVKNPSGGIQGVYSLSELTPIKQANFELSDTTFTGSKKYSDWKFVISGAPLIKR